MPDVLYILLTVASFVAIALLVGLLDRRLSGDSDGGGR